MPKENKFGIPRPALDSFSAGSAWPSNVPLARPTLRRAFALRSFPEDCQQRLVVMLERPRGGDLACRGGAALTALRIEQLRQTIGESLRIMRVIHDVAL